MTDSIGQQIDARFAALESRVAALESPVPPVPIPPPAPNVPTIAGLKFVGCFGLQTPAVAYAYDKPDYPGNPTHTARPLSLIESRGRVYYENEVLWCSSHDYSKWIAPFEIPATLEATFPNAKPVAKQIGPWEDILHNRMFDFEGGLKRMGGFCRINGKWAATIRDDHNVAGTKNPCLVYDGRPLATILPHCSMTAGYLVPKGESVYCGLAGTGGNSHTSFGPVVFRFPAADIEKSVIETEQIAFTPIDKPFPGWLLPPQSSTAAAASRVRACVIRNGHALLFGCLGVGLGWYGDGNAGPDPNDPSLAIREGLGFFKPDGTPSGINDPCTGQSEKGPHATGGREPYCWIVRLSDGKLIEHGSLRVAMGNPTAECLEISGGSDDPVTGRIYLTTKDLWTPNIGRHPMVWAIQA